MLELSTIASGRLVPNISPRPGRKINLTIINNNTRKIR
jgi:hypothetical protein